MELLEKIDPWGQSRDDYRAARIIQSFTGGKIRNILKLFDFEEGEEQVDEDVEELFNRR